MSRLDHYFYIIQPTYLHVYVQNRNWASVTSIPQKEKKAIANRPLVPFNDRYITFKSFPINKMLYLNNCQFKRVLQRSSTMSFFAVQVYVCISVHCCLMNPYVIDVAKGRKIKKIKT